MYVDADSGPPNAMQTVVPAHHIRPCFQANSRPLLCISAIGCLLAAIAIGSSSLNASAGMQQLKVPATAAPGSLIAIADLHGDLNKAKTALRLLQLIDTEGHWLAKDVTVVQVGEH